jgi:hypothetical protein
VSFGLYRDRITVVRRTAFLIAETEASAASLSLTTQPGDPAYLEVRIRNGASNTGTVAITGLDSAGNALSQTMTFDGTVEYQQTSKAFASVNPLGLVLSGFSDETPIPDITIRAVGADGSPMGEQRSTVATSWPAHIDHGRASWPRAVQGTQELETGWIGIPQTTAWTPQEGDEVTDQYGQKYELQGTPRWRGSAGDHHWECPMARREA